MQNTTEQIKDRATPFPLQPGGEFGGSLMQCFQIIVILQLKGRYKFIYTVKPASNGIDIVQTFYIKYGDILQWIRNLMKQIVDNQNFNIL